MKKLFVLLGLVFVSQAAYSQVVVNGVNINNLEEVTMVRLIVQERFLSNQVVVFVDYGQGVQGAPRRAREVINPSDGRRIRFNSTMHAVNFMIDNGWEYMESMVLPTDGNATSSGDIQYLFRRPLN
ncbi:MAG: hypothetical protein AAF433_17285 [Bacteroidota bacterium]